MFGWLAQAEPIVVDSESQLLLLLGLFVFGAFVLLALILLMVLRRMRKSQSRQTEVQSRLEDLAQPNYEAPPLTPAEVPANPPAGTDPDPVEAAQTLTPIEQKLLAVEQAEKEAAAAAEVAAAGATTVQEEPQEVLRSEETEAAELPTGDYFGDLELEEDVNVDALWDDLNIEFEQGGELAFLMGDGLPEEDASTVFDPEPPLTVLADIDARTFLEQVNQYRLKNRGQVAETERECRLSWQSAVGTHEILVTVQDAETLDINGDSFPATPDGVKQGIVAALNNANY